MGFKRQIKDLILEFQRHTGLHKIPVKDKVDKIDQGDFTGVESLWGALEDKMGQLFGLLSGIFKKAQE